MIMICLISNLIIIELYRTIDDEIQLCLGTQSFMLAIT